MKRDTRARCSSKHHNRDLAINGKCYACGERNEAVLRELGKL
jgi:hypothetical protein